jgi:hypothetical protein
MSCSPIQPLVFPNIHPYNTDPLTVFLNEILNWLFNLTT